jgi:hypothetical protein
MNRFPKGSRLRSDAGSFTGSNFARSSCCRRHKSVGRTFNDVVPGRFETVSDAF